ncbi:MAG: redoxin domain-containing protein [Planctomycetaceae bacterium]
MHLFEFRRIGNLLILTAIAWICVSGRSALTAADLPIADFSLQTHRGQRTSLNDFADRKLIVIAFLGTQCPLAKLYGPRLAELHGEYSDRGVAFVGINSNTQDSITEITAYVNRHEIPFPVLKDPGNRVADQFGAERTPEVFVLDQNRKVRYRGRIDDQYLVGLSRDRVRRRDLAIAIEELLSGNEASVTETEAIGCHIGRIQKVEPTGDVTYANQISRIFNSRCLECHRDGQIAPFSLAGYADTIGWEDTILEVIADNRMPPWYANPDHGTFRNDARLSDDEKQLIRTWVENGMPEGDPSQLPDPPEFATGWRMPQPDQVIAMSDEAFTVPATGVVNYQYFSVDPGWTEDKFVTAAEARPDNFGVVHHIIAYAIPPGDEEERKKQRTMLVGYAPGATPNVLDDGIAMYIPAGSTLLFEMHYTPNGSQQSDRSHIGLKFTEKKNVRKLLQGRVAMEADFEIPAGASNHEVTAEYRARRDELLLCMTPHMHVRGRSFRFEAFYPDGGQEILLDVPKYDFNWQLNYRLSEPKLLPKGTRILCTAAFDNSDANPVNPDPGRSVRWGDQSWEEMMIGFLDVVEPDAAASASSAEH